MSDRILQTVKSIGYIVGTSKVNTVHSPIEHLIQDLESCFQTSALIISPEWPVCFPS